MFTRKKAEEKDHAQVEETLSKHEHELKQMARRLRRLEIEAGIFKPPLKKVG